MSWTQDNIRKIYSLRGRQLEAINIIEMAILESGKNGLPQYTHLKCPFLQAQVIEWIFTDGSISRFHTSQNCDRWSIQLDLFSASTPKLTYKNNPQSIFRFVSDIGLPTGRIDRLDLKLDSEDNVDRILFEIDNSELLFVAGEVYEDGDDIYILLEDESILIFDNPSQIENVCFGRAIDL